MKKFLSLALAVVMTLSALLLTGCNAVKKNNVDAIKEAGKLTVFTEAGFAPYEFIANGKIVGVDIKIMEAVAAKLGKKLVVEDVNFDSIVGAVKSGKADAGAAGITITAERAEVINFSTPYYTESIVVVCKADDKTFDSAGTVVDVLNSICYPAEAAE